MSSHRLESSHLKVLREIFGGGFQLSLCIILHTPQNILKHRLFVSQTSLTKPEELPDD